MINKKIEEIGESDLQALVDNKVLEGKTIEYKRELPNNSDSSKKEFLADVTSFANSGGGDLILGIAEEKGEPKSLCGIEIENRDIEKTRLDNIIRSGVEPRILSISIKPIPLNNSKLAILLRIPKSWNGPHRVILGGHAKFYARNSSGKYELDVDELRIAFNLTDTLIDRIRNFRVERITKVLADETPIRLYPNAKIILHLIPFNSFNPSQQYDIDSLTSEISKPHDKLPLIYRSVMNWRYNLDGLFTHSDSEEGIFSAYTQLYRTGIIEAVDASLLRPRENGLLIPSLIYEKKLIDTLTAYMRLLPDLGIEPPIFVFLTLIGVNNYKMGIRRELYFDVGHPIDRTIILLPEVIIDNFSISAKDALKPLFDLIWNACGYRKSLNFDENGNWTER
ncbi:MAG: ATP-binding protein [Nitrospirae bacterium]|nr:ATP-binding protein [Nitrospirota bacterium]